MLCDAMCTNAPYYLGMYIKANNPRALTKHIHNVHTHPYKCMGTNNPLHHRTTGCTTTTPPPQTPQPLPPPQNNTHLLKSPLSRENEDDCPPNPNPCHQLSLDANCCTVAASQDNSPPRPPPHTPPPYPPPDANEGPVGDANEGPPRGPVVGMSSDTPRSAAGGAVVGVATWRDPPMTEGPPAMDAGASWERRETPAGAAAAAARMLWVLLLWVLLLWVGGVVEEDECAVG